MSIKKVTVIGAGVMGKQIALNAAIHGFDVTVYDAVPVALSALLEWSEGYLASRVSKGKLTNEEHQEISKRFFTAASIEQAVCDADLVIEAVIEKLEVKHALFAQLDSLCKPETILASNSSTFFPSQYAAVTKRADKVIGAHYFNPALQMQLLELVLSDAVSEQTLETMQAFGQTIAKRVIVARKEIEGFIVNNLFGGITNVAWFLLENGYATFEDIDLAAEKGLGHPMGPFRTMDYSGLDTILNVRNSRHQLNPEKHPAPTQLLVEKVQGGDLGIKSGKGFYDYSKKS